MILCSYDKVSSLLSASVNGLDYLRKFSGGANRMCHLVFASKPQLQLHMSASEEEHQGARIVQLILSVEIRHLVYIDQKNLADFLDGTTGINKHSISKNTLWIVVVSKS